MDFNSLFSKPTITKNGITKNGITNSNQGFNLNTPEVEKKIRLNNIKWGGSNNIIGMYLPIIENNINKDYLLPMDDNGFHNNIFIFKRLMYLNFDNKSKKIILNEQTKNIFNDIPNVDEFIEKGMKKKFREDGQISIINQLSFFFLQFAPKQELQLIVITNSLIDKFFISLMKNENFELSFPTSLYNDEKLEESHFFTKIIKQPFEFNKYEANNDKFQVLISQDSKGCITNKELRNGISKIIDYNKFVEYLKSNSINDYLFKKFYSLSPKDDMTEYINYMTKIRTNKIYNNYQKKQETLLNTKPKQINGENTDIPDWIQNDNLFDDVTNADSNNVVNTEFDDLPQIDNDDILPF